MYFLPTISICFCILPCLLAYPITYNDVRGTPYKVSYDHRAFTINNVRTMLISGAIHYSRSTPAMWPYIMRMAKDQGLNTIQTYVFWNLHEPKQGVLDFSGRANLSQFLQAAADAGLFVNLRIGPYVDAEWNYGGLPAWLNQIPNISFRSSNDAWKNLMRQFMLNILDYVTPFLAKNGGPIILSQIENEYKGDDTAYVDWCGDLVNNELSVAEIPWIMCGGATANSTIETCNSCNCFDNHWMEGHRREYPDTPLIFTENEGWFQQWGRAVGIRETSDISYSVAEWFADGGAYHCYYMWHGGNNYGRTAASGITTMYADDVSLHADGTPNEPKYTQLSRLQHLIADRAKDLLSQDANRSVIPYWDGTEWKNGTRQFVFSYQSSTHFVINQNSTAVTVLFQNKTIPMKGQSVQIYDEQMMLLWDSANFSDISSDNTKITPVVVGPLQWKTWSESGSRNSSVISSPYPLEQLNITNDETIYLWYRRNITVKQTSKDTIITAQTWTANALLFFLDGQFLGEFDNHEHDHSTGNVNATLAVDLSNFQADQEYLFEVLSVSLGLNTYVQPHRFEWKGIVGNLTFDGELLVDQQNLWEHQKGLIGEHLQIYTEEGSSKVDWKSEWTKSINKPITWFQARFDLDHLISENITANPILLDAQGLNRGHAFINGNDLGLYWLIQGLCQDGPLGGCQQAQINCLQPTQRYYHIPPDWLKPKNNLITVFDDLGAPSPGSVGLVQRTVRN